MKKKWSLNEKYTELQDLYSTYQICPLSVTLNAIGGKWKPAVYRVISLGVHRFGEMHHALEGISKRMLTRYLREMEKDGIIHREVFPVVPPKVEYSLTDFGKTLKPVFAAIEKWGLEHGDKTDTTPDE
ncbi:helix-turn-helix domain-containing protein [uncultured Microscilla sp.]|uniref:winged helix-turn-helix transcriptional regulator n=1 Tax=uncultured Microscilla sp. TaxID=432653 RepID=UPI002608DBFC|nr:helix-turn-helix domain-containing protein [uncultured Microscilla sp.]